MGGMDHLLVFLWAPLGLAQQAPEQVIGFQRKGFVPQLAVFSVCNGLVHGKAPFSNSFHSLLFLPQPQRSGRLTILSERAQEETPTGKWTPLSSWQG
jgi:hypothetical protein